MPNLALFDSVDPFLIPTSAQAVAGYVNGRYAWPESGWARFPHAFKKTISIRPDQVAYVLDVEQGDAEPDQVPGWCHLCLAGGLRRPTAYCSRLGTWPATRAAVHAAGLDAVVDYWVADYTGQPHLVPGSVATQWIDSGPYDLSVADQGWLAGAVVPALNGPPVAILPTPDSLGYFIVCSDGGVFSKGSAVFRGSGVGLVASPVTSAAITSSGAGYWLVCEGGQVYAFGDAPYHGNAP